MEGGIMAHFRGIVKGGRGEASRLGHKTTGLTTTCNSWNLGIKVEAGHVNGQDVFRIYLTDGSRRAKLPQLIATITNDESSDKWDISQNHYFKDIKGGK